MTPEVGSECKRCFRFGDKAENRHPHYTLLESVLRAGSSCCVSCAGLLRASGGRSARHLINRCLNVSLKCPIVITQLMTVLSKKTETSFPFLFRLQSVPHSSLAVTDEDTVKRYYAKFEEKFFQTCEKELSKINTFYS
ncbi:hypothetical protein DNTS_033712, partial [Danionella cerebrum]